jgi:PIF1-like helicase
MVQWSRQSWQHTIRTLSIQTRESSLMRSCMQPTTRLARLSSWSRWYRQNLCLHHSLQPDSFSGKNCSLCCIWNSCTSHSCFQIPLIIHESSICSISRDSICAKLLEKTELIVWDEALMQHHNLPEAVNRIFKDALQSDQLFGGIPVVFGGDFHQILPVIERGSQPQIVGASLQCSILWQHIKVLHLKINM